MSFAGANILVTGGSSGIGKATAQQLAAAGANLYLVARDGARLDATLHELRAQLGDPASQIIRAYPADVSDFEQVSAVVGQLAAEGRAPDYLFNFAGMARPGYFQDLPVECFHDHMNVNFFGTLHTAKAVAPLMMERRSGHIINTSSVAGLLGVFGYTAYGASKFAIRGFTDVLRMELKPYGVRVSILYPPDTDTPQLHAENKVKPAETRALAGNTRMMTAGQVAAELLRGVQKGRYMIIPGFEGKMIWMAACLLGGKMNLILDWMVRRAQRESGGPARVAGDSRTRYP